MELTDLPLCSFSSTALPHDALLVSSWEGEEAMSRPYRFDIRLATLDPSLDDELMLGKSATLTLFNVEGASQQYHGVVTEVEQMDSDERYFYLRVTLEPRMALLRQHSFSDVWLDKNLPDLIRAVLKETGLLREGPGMQSGRGADYDFDIRLASDDLALTAVNFTCQYEETSFAFLSRLLEYYGVYYYFEQQAGQEALVLCGDLRYQPQVPTPVQYRPLDSALDVEVSGAVARTFKRQVTSQTRQVVLQDFSASDAQLQLQVSASVGKASMASTAIQASSAFQGVHGVYGEHFGSNKDGQWLATRRAEAIGCRHREFHGVGRAFGLRAGYPMQLLSHPRSSFNAIYQVIEVAHCGSQPLPGLADDRSGVDADYNTRFIALSGDVQFRAPCVTPRPHVQGMLSAVIDGDDDPSQPLLNKHGCYKVRFPFVRSEKAASRGSAWLRMASLSSGASHGMHFPLLKGTEVLVSFIGGDPDRPIITGSVPNSENPNKVSAANATQSGLSSPGGHYLAIDDRASGGVMKLGAPAGNSTFSLGGGLVNGASLATDAHLQLASTSHKQTVAGIYSLNLGAEEEESEEKPLSGKELLDIWGGPSWGNFGVKAGWSNARTVSIELKTAVEEVEATVGMSKQALTARVHTTEAAIGVKTEIALHPGTREFKSGMTGLVGAIKNQFVSRKVESVASEYESVTTQVKGGTYTLESTALIEISCGSHKISLNREGITISSSNTITLETDVHIKGNLSVGNYLVCSGDCEVKKELKVGSRVQTPEVRTSSLQAGKANLASPIVLDPLAQSMVVKSTVDKDESLKKVAGAAGTILHKATLKAGSLVQDIREEAVKKNPLVQ